MQEDCNVSENAKKDSHRQWHTSAMAFFDAGKRDLTVCGDCHKFNPPGFSSLGLNKPALTCGYPGQHSGGGKMAGGRKKTDLKG